MKLKQTVLIMMAATLPLTSMAAASETIPVTKDTGAVVAQNNRHDVTYRLSSTATPEQNKKLRSVAINTTIKKYVSKVQNDTQKLNEKESNKTNVIMYYDVKTDKNGIFSVLIHTYTMRDGDANGVTYVKGFTFNTTTGRQLSLYDLGGLNKKELVNAINNNQQVKDAVGANATFDKMPSEFYTTEDYSVVMILQQDVDTIHSAGAVYVPVGNLRDRQNDVTK